MLEELTLTKAVDYAIEITHHNALFHSEMVRRFADEKDLKNVCLMCRADENIHEINLKRLKDIVPSGLTPNENRLEKMFFLQVMSHSDFLTNETLLLDKLHSIRTKEEALNLALRIEKDSLSYHMAMKDALGNYDILASIIRDEKAHLSELMECLISSDGGSLQTRQAMD